MKEQLAKSLLVKTKQPEYWFNVEYNMNMYRGCSHGCIYCDSRSECYRIDDFEDITVKSNAPQLLRRELARLKRKALIGTGAMSDPYIPAERGLKLTGQLLEVLLEANFPVHITTKSDLIVRDKELLGAIAARSFASAGFTVTTCDERLSSWIEPHAPAPSARLTAMKALADQGVYTGILLMPVLPFLLDHPGNLTTVMEQAKLHGARFIIPMFGVTLRDRQREYYYQKLGGHRPLLVSQYQRAYGGRYHCESFRAKQLWSMLQDYCRKHGIACTMDGLKQFPKEEEPEQLDLF
ncbi:MAG: radical protein [Paenibacillaceae bacterium]|jgi:DNA repair photolyase|nr:radical protein [Paenibacillaceae bacterium]